MTSLALRRRAVCVGTSLLLATAACASGSSSDSLMLQPVPSGSRYLVTSAEISGAGVNTALEALRRLRPDLVVRRTTTMRDDPFEGAPVLYLDGQFQGKLDMLASVPASTVKEMRYHTAVVANNLFGKFYSGGVVAVVTRRQTAEDQ